MPTNNISVLLANIDKNSRLELEVTEILNKARIPANIKGFHYLRTAIMLSVYDDEMVHCITKRLYPAIATRHRTTPSRAERAIRHAIETAWSKGGLENLSKIISYEIYSKKKPTNSKFIAAIADYLRLKQKKQKE